MRHVLATCFIFVFVAGCESVQRAEDRTDIQISRLEVPDPVRVGSYFLATFHGVKKHDADITIQDACFTFTWTTVMNSEGPYCLKLTRENLQKQTVEIRLWMRKPSRYIISGYLRYISRGQEVRQTQTVWTSLNVIE